MRKLKRIWMKFSVKRKISAVVLCCIIIMTISEGITLFYSRSTFKELENIMSNNSIYYELQEAIKEEKETFVVYIRNRTDENRIAFEDACTESAECINALPFDYSEIGEERYARTWNIVNGYNGYIAYRNKIVEKTEGNPEYITELYEVLGMQDRLLDYAFRLVQVTMEQLSVAYEEKMQMFRYMPFGIAVSIVLMMGFMIWIWQLVSETMVSPLVMIAEDSRKIAANELDSPSISVENEDEIGDLVTAYNKMKDAMRKYISTLELLHKEEIEKVEMEKSLEQAQLEVLKQQVNPHFLFNTLNMISSMAKLEDAETTDRMIVSLGNLFRYNLHTVEQEVYLEQELEVLDDYIYIQQMRFDNRIEYVKLIEVDEREVRIPSFTLQPLVENAFIHGVSSKEEGGRITIRIWELEEKVIITIADNGVGMDQDKLEDLNEKIHKEDISRRGIGLGNICKRIDMMYEGGRFKIYSTRGRGTIIRLEVPQKEAQEDENVQNISCR